MFPHIEGPYAVEQRFEKLVMLRGLKSTVVVELRRDTTPIDYEQRKRYDELTAKMRAQGKAYHQVPRELGRYIALSVSNGARLDVLLQYQEGEDSLLEQDFAYLRALPNMAVLDEKLLLKELKYAVYLEDHAGGRLRGGGYLMF